MMGSAALNARVYTYIVSTCWWCWFSWHRLSASRSINSKNKDPKWLYSRICGSNTSNAQCITCTWGTIDQSSLQLLSCRKYSSLALQGLYRGPIIVPRMHQKSSHGLPNTPHRSLDWSLLSSGRAMGSGVIYSYRPSHRATAVCKPYISTINPSRISTPER